MKKSLITLAVMAVAGAAQAQSSVTLFGVMDVGYGQHKTTGEGGRFIKSSGVMDGGNAGSRVGFRGTENLGGGLSADFWIEQGLSFTNDEMFGARTAAAGHQVDGFSASGGSAAVNGAAGAYSTGTNRQSYVGLRGGFGTVRVGYQYTNLYELATLSGYAIGSEGVQGGDKAHLIRQDQFGGTRGNGLTYISPAFSGITLRAQYGAGAGRESVSGSAVITPTQLTLDETKRMSVMAHYSAGPISAAVAHTKTNAVSSARAINVQTTNVYGALSAPTTAAVAAADSTRTLNQVGASYTMKVAKVGLVYSDGDNGNLGSKMKGLQVGASVPFGKTVPFVNWGQASVTTAATGVKSEDYKLMQIGVRHNLSNRTTAYIMTGSTKNDAAAAKASGFTDRKSVV